MHLTDFHVSQIQVGTYKSSTSSCCWYFHLSFRKEKFHKSLFLQKENSCNTFLFHPGLSHAGCAIHHWWRYASLADHDSHQNQKQQKEVVRFGLKPRVSGFREILVFSPERRKVKCSNFPPALLLPVSVKYFLVLRISQTFRHFLFTTTISKPISNNQITNTF